GVVYFNHGLVHIHRRCRGAGRASLAVAVRPGVFCADAPRVTQEIPMRWILALGCAVALVYGCSSDSASSAASGGDGARVRAATTAPATQTAGAMSAAAAAGGISLFNGRDLSGWTHVLEDPNVRPEDVWSVADGVLRCTGRPAGYLRTIRDFENYMLE